MCYFCSSESSHNNTTVHKNIKSVTSKHSFERANMPREMINMTLKG